LFIQTRKIKNISVSSLPVLINGEIRGIVWTGFSMDILNEQVDGTLKKTRKRIIAVASAGLFIGIIGALILSSMMTRPIKKMVQARNLSATASWIPLLR